MKYRFDLEISRPLILVLSLCLFMSWAFTTPCFSLEKKQDNSPKTYTLPQTKPEDVGLSSEKLKELSAFVETGVEEKRIPGAVVLVARDGKIAYLESFWNEGRSNERTNEDGFHFSNLLNDKTCRECWGIDVNGRGKDFS